MEFILGFAIGAVVSGLAFIIFHKNNMNKINKAREEILTAYKNSPVDEAVAKAEQIFGKYFKK